MKCHDKSTYLSKIRNFCCVMNQREHLTLRMLFGKLNDAPFVTLNDAVPV